MSDNDTARDSISSINTTMGDLSLNPQTTSNTKTADSKTADGKAKVKKGL